MILATIFINVEEPLITITLNPNSVTAKIIKVYNINGNEVPLDTKNELIILLYNNGYKKKVIQH